jgi:hypothetical protein
VAIAQILNQGLKRGNDVALAVLVCDVAEADVVVTGVPPAAALTAWVNACSRLANKVIP